MLDRTFTIVITLLSMIGLGRAATPDRGEQYKVKPQFLVKVPMRDGVNLSADIYRPDAPGKFPVLLYRTYSDNTAPAKVNMALMYAKRGYVMVIQDIRGRFDSDGVWDPYVNDPKDGYDTQQWIGKQPWCNGKIGTIGVSYDGFTQLMSAPLGSPYVKCMVPNSCQQTNFGHLYNDGVMQLNVVIMAGIFYSGRTMQASHDQSSGRNPKAIKVLDFEEVFRRLPLISATDDITDAPYIHNWIQHDQYDDYWKSYGIKDKYKDIKAPAYFITGWYDNLLHDTMRNFVGFHNEGGSIEARQGTKIIIGPWTHGIRDPRGEHWDADIGKDAIVDYNALHLRWYEHWLKAVDNGLEKEPPIKLYTMGASKWRTENEWPLARTKWTNYYLSGGGNANSLTSDGILSASKPNASSADKYTYDPRDPVPTWGGNISMPLDLQGPRDRRTIEKRKDVLNYTSAPLTGDLEVTGPVEVKLYAASSAPDTDFTGTLTDVYPDGRSVIVCEGIRGARFRESLEHPTLIHPGQVYEYSISLWETSNLFKAGHKIRLEISSSNFPRYARNQNTSHPFGTSADLNVAQQTIFHDAQHPSRLILPVIPD